MFESFMTGTLVGLSLTLSVASVFDKVPREHLMQAQCETVNANLKRYDTYQFECDNKAIFKMHTIDSVSIP